MLPNSSASSASAFLLRDLERCGSGGGNDVTPALSFFSTVYYEGLQDKLAQIRDARGALSALREEHREKLRRAAEEAERQRQIQLAQKLEIMRQKKQVRLGS